MSKTNLNLVVSLIYDNGTDRITYRRVGIVFQDNEKNTALTISNSSWTFP
ncbi:hypothetical protein [Pelagibius sp. Alg239-R121]|nr:hypothetical protein [Pelagibius sp. Alg239-R121]